VELSGKECRGSGAMSVYFKAKHDNSKLSKDGSGEASGMTPISRARNWALVGQSIYTSKLEINREFL
jgi:hypothetical protein